MVQLTLLKEKKLLVIKKQEWFSYIKFKQRYVAVKFFLFIKNCLTMICVNESQSIWDLYSPSTDLQSCSLLAQEEMESTPPARDDPTISTCSS